MGLTIQRRNSTKTRAIITLVALFALVAQPMYGLMKQQSVHALIAQDAHKVMQGDFSLDSWFYYDDETNSFPSVGNSNQIVKKPLTSSAQDNGAVKLVGGKMNLATALYGGTKLADLQNLSFDVYSERAGGAYINLDVDFDSTDSNTAWQKRLVWVPNTTVNTWGTVNALSNPDIAQWSWSGYSSNGNKWIDNTTSPEKLSWNEIKSKWPNASIGIYDGIYFRADKARVYYDNVNIETTTRNDLYNFELNIPPTPQNGDPVDSAMINTNDFYFTWSEVNNATYEFQAKVGSYSLDEFGGIVGAWNSIDSGSTEQKNLIQPKIHSTGASDGKWHWQVRAINANGIKGAWSSVWGVTIDTKKPTGSVAYSNNGNVTKSDVTVTIKVDEPIKPIADWTWVSDSEYTKIFTENSNGPKNVSIEDYAGNKGVVKYEVKRIDKIAPVINGLVDGAIYNEVVSYTVTETSLSRLIVNGEEVPYVTPSTGHVYAANPISADGVYTIEAIDKAGNSTSVTFIIDRTAPTLTINSPILNIDGTYRLSGTTTDGSAPVFIAKNGTTTGQAVIGAQLVPGGVWSWSIFVGELIADEQYIFTVTSVDGAGNNAVAQFISYKVPAVDTTNGVIKRVEGANLATSSSSSAVLFNDRFNTVGASSFVADPSEVLGVRDVKDVDTGILGASKDIAAIAPSAQGWKFFGYAWYWWLLAIAAVAAIWWWIAAARRRNQEA